MFRCCAPALLVHMFWEKHFGPAESLLYIVHWGSSQYSPVSSPLLWPQLVVLKEKKSVPVCFEIGYPKGVLFYCPTAWTLACVLKAVFFFLNFLLPILKAVASFPDLTKLLAVTFSSWGISFPLGCDRTKQRAKSKNWRNQQEKNNIPCSDNEQVTEFSCGNSPGKGDKRLGEYCKAAPPHTLLLPGDTGWQPGWAFAPGSPAWACSRYFSPEDFTFWLQG